MDVCVCLYACVYINVCLFGLLLPLDKTNMTKQEYHERIFLLGPKYRIVVSAEQTF